MFQLVEYPILNVVIDICFIFMSLALALCIYYVIVGPQPSERIISADAIFLQRDGADCALQYHRGHHVVYALRAGGGDLRLYRHDRDE